MSVLPTKIALKGQLAQQNGSFWNPVVTASQSLPGKKTVYQNPVSVTTHIGNTLLAMTANNSRKNSFPVTSKVYPESSSYYFRTRKPNGHTR